MAFDDIEIKDGEEFSEESIAELTNGKGDDNE